MSLGNCIPGMIERGEISQQRGRRMAELFEQLEGYYRRSMSPEAAAAEASEQTLVALTAEAALKKRQALLAAAVQKRGIDDMVRYKGASPYDAIRAMLDDDLNAPYENVTRRSARIEFDAQARISDFIERHRRNFLGKMQDRAGGDDVVRELFGEASGNARAATFAGAIADTFEDLRLRFNAAGGAIARLEGWGLPQAHDTMKVRAAGFDQWRADILDGLDPSRMRDARDGGALTPERLEEALRASFDEIRTNGNTGEPTSAFRGSGKLANQRADHRFFVFRDADAWLAYQAKYGRGDPFSTVMGHIRGMANDIAMMERLGPNPDATMRLLFDAADKAAHQGDGEIVGTAKRGLAEATWKFVKGETSVPVIRETAMGRAVVGSLGGARNLMTAAMLGSAPLSAISDVNTQLLARSFSGLPQTRVILSYLKQLNPASAADRKLAIRLGLGMRDASHTLGGMARFYGETNNPGWTSVIADDVLRVAGLNKWTEAGQRAFGLDFLGHLGGLRGDRFDKLPAATRETMERYGISAADWNEIRAAEPERQGGAEFVNAANVADRGAADRLMDMVLGETASAVPEPTATARAVLSFGQQPGTVGGELLRSVTQFKSFAVSLMMQQAQRMAALGPYRGGIHAARFFIGMTLFGALAIQLREIAKGRDPRPMDDAEFWSDAAFQGGGLGIFGDLVGGYVRDFTSGRVRGLGELMGGPLVSVSTDLTKAAVTALPRTRKDGSTREGNPGAAAIQFGKRYTPGGTLWYLRAAYERMVLDQLAAEIDPGYLDQRRRVEQWADENGQGLWWQPGAVAPDRAPDVGNALGRSDETLR